MGPLDDLTAALRRFVAERDWEKFHSPKNLAMALSVEVAELAEHFQWLTEQESRELPPDRRAKVEEELADVFIYLLRLCDELGVDLEAATHRKLLRNAERYPARKVRGRAVKHSELD